MTFTGDEDQTIPLSTASTWTANYRRANTGATMAHQFGQTIINDILAQEGCVGIRVYYALDDNGAKELILTGVDSSGNDLYNGVLGDRSYKCPTCCSSPNSLNS